MPWSSSGRTLVRASSPCLRLVPIWRCHPDDIHRRPGFFDPAENREDHDLRLGFEGDAAVAVYYGATKRGDAIFVCARQTPERYPAAGCWPVGGCRLGTCRTVSPGRQAASCSVSGLTRPDTSSQAPSADQLTANPTSPPPMTAPGTASSRRAATSMTPALADVTAPAPSPPPNTTAT